MKLEPLVLSVGCDHPRANPITSTPREAISGAGVILVACNADLADAILRVKGLGAGQIIPINPDGPDCDSNIDLAIQTLRAGTGGQKPPSKSLLRASQACAVSFPSDTFGALQPGVEKMARLAGAPPEFIGAALLGTVSGIIGGRYYVRVREGFEVPIVNWFALVGCASSGKSPALDSVLKILRRVEGDYFRQHNAAVAAAEAEGKDAVKKVPPARRAIVSNATIESLHHIAAAQGRTLICSYDELSDWFGSILKYSKSAVGDRGAWLAAHNAIPLTVDRRGLGNSPLHVRCWGLSLVGAIPPSVLSNLGANGELSSGDGLDVRMLYVFPSLPPIQLRPNEEDAGAEGQFEAAFRVLMEWRTQAADAEPIPFAPDARERFEIWRFDLLTKARTSSSEVDSWIGKLPGLVCRLAGALCCLDAATQGVPPKSITLDQLKRAAKLSDVLSAHRRKVELERGKPTIERLAAELGGFILTHKMKTLDTFEVRKGLVPGIRSEKVLKQTLLEMQAAGWLAPSTFISPRSDDPLPPEVKIRDEVFELVRKVH